MISFENVSKIYQTAKGEVRALDDVTFSIDAGEFVAVCGPSGCGKSTLLSLTGGLALPTSGNVTVFDAAVSGMNSAERAEFRAENVGYVFQMFHLLPYLTVLDNVLVAAHDQGSELSRGEAESLLEQFDLADRLTHRPAELSAGERQRVAMARALLNRPKLLLADEPTGNLDPKNAAGVLDLLNRFHEEGGTVILVTHDEKAAQRATRIIELEKGRTKPEPATAAQ